MVIRRSRQYHERHNPASVTQSNQPALNPATSLRRYWTLTSSGGPFTADLTFKYLDGDVFGNENNYRLIRVSGGTPVHFPNDCVSGSLCLNTAANMATIRGVTQFSDWTLGEPPAPTAADGTISGQVTKTDGAPLAGATMQLNGAQSRKTITDANGSYRFDHVETGGFYTITPSRANFSFSPGSRSFSQVGNRTEAAFTGVASGDATNATNPLDTPEYFVRQQYVDVLGREPDEGGFNYWSDQINRCGVDQACERAQRINVAAAFF